MAEVTDKDLEQKRKKVTDLRDQVKRARADRVAAEQSVVNEVAAARLDNEIAQLEQELEAEKKRSSVKVVRAASEENLKSPEERMAEAAAAEAEAAAPTAPKVNDKGEGK